MSADTLARTICLIVALINQFLAMFGKDVLPFGEDMIYQVVTIIFTLVTSALAWWKNNSVTKAAKEADKYMKELKANEE